jgi:hypothetical protein
MPKVELSHHVQLLLYNRVMTWGRLMRRSP